MSVSINLYPALLPHIFIPSPPPVLLPLQPFPHHYPSHHTLNHPTNCTYFNLPMQPYAGKIHSKKTKSNQIQSTNQKKSHIWPRIKNQNQNFVAGLQQPLQHAYVETFTQN